MTLKQFAFPLLAVSSFGLLGSYCSPGDFKVIVDDTGGATVSDGFEASRPRSAAAGTWQRPVPILLFFPSIAAPRG